MACGGRTPQHRLQVRIRIFSPASQPNLTTYNGPCSERVSLGREVARRGVEVPSFPSFVPVHRVCAEDAPSEYANDTTATYIPVS